MIDKRFPFNILNVFNDIINFEDTSEPRVMIVYVADPIFPCAEFCRWKLMVTLSCTIHTDGTGCVFMCALFMLS